MVPPPLLTTTDDDISDYTSRQAGVCDSYMSLPCLGDVIGKHGSDPKKKPERVQVTRGGV